MSDIPPDMTLEQAWGLLQDLNTQLLAKDKEIATLWEKLEEASVDVMEALKAENVSLKAELESLRASIAGGPGVPAVAPLDETPAPAVLDELPPLDETPAPAALDELPPLDEAPVPSPVAAPVPVQEPASQPPAGPRVSVFFNQAVTDKVAYIDEGFKIMRSIAGTNHSGEEIGLNLDAFKEKLKSIVGFSPSLFPMTSMARNMKKIKDPVDVSVLNDLKDNLQRWKGEIIELASK